MSEYKAIALDMDGTLLTRDHKISSATRAALAQARAHGIKVLLVTGRHYMTARPFHHELALDTPLICSNGAYLYDPVQNRILSGDPLAAALVAESITRYGQQGTPIRAVMLARLGPNVWHDTPAAAMATLEELEETAKLWIQAPAAPLTEAQIDELRHTFNAYW